MWQSIRSISVEYSVFSEHFHYDLCQAEYFGLPFAEFHAAYTHGFEERN